MMRSVRLFLIVLFFACNARAQRLFHDSVQQAIRIKTLWNTAKLDSLEQKINQLGNQHQYGQQFAAMRQYSSLCDSTGQDDAFLANGRAMELVAQKTQNQFMKATAYITIGIGLNYKFKLDSASYYEFKALQIGKAIQHDSLQAEAYACLSSIYIIKKNWQQSLRFCEQALPYVQKWGTSKELLAVCLGCKAMAHTALQQHNEAIQMDLQVLSLAKELHNYNYIVTAKINLAKNYVALHQYSEARYYLNQLEKELPVYRLAPIYYYGNLTILGMTYKEMGDYKKAVIILSQQIPFLKAFNYTAMLRNVYDSLSIIAEKNQRYKDALMYKRLAIQYEQQLQKQNSDQLFSELEVRYHTAENERILSQKNLLLQKNRYYMYYTIAALVVALLITALLYLQSRHKKQVHIRELKAMQQQKELHLLQALMQGEEKERSRIAKDLHDGISGMLAAVKMHFSSILSADYLSETEGFQQGMKLLNEAMQEIRKTSHNLMPEILLQHGLDEALRRYCNSVNNRKALQIQYDSWGIIDRYADNFELSVYRIVQELLNNIIRHSRATQAMVQLTQQDDVLSISIEDNGIGFNVGKTIEGIGLHSLEKRIKAMNGRMEIDASMQNGVSAYLEFEVSGLKKQTHHHTNKLHENQ